ncbi:hypothetical protein [Nioella sp.]|uniref:hypothetical protein n=1 Tax=Nioella sp. TaxID=1912091 RepID=UPI003B5183AA
MQTRNAILVILYAALAVWVGTAKAQHVDDQCEAEIIRQITLDWAPDRTAGRYDGDTPQTICCAVERPDLGNPAGNFYVTGRVAAMYLHPNSSNALSCSVPLLTMAVVAEDFSGAFTEYAVGQYEFHVQMRDWMREDRLEYDVIQEFGGLGSGQIIEFGCTQDGRYVAAQVRCPCGSEYGACQPRYSNLRVDPIETAPAQPIQPVQLAPQGQPIPQGGLRHAD